MTQLHTMTGSRFLDPFDEPNHADEHYTPRHLRAVPLSPELQQALDEAFSPEPDPVPAPAPVVATPPAPAPIPTKPIPEPTAIARPTPTPAPAQPTSASGFPDPAAYAARRVMGDPAPAPGGLFRRKVDPSRLIVPSPTDHS
jgi:hypothetical protein